MKVTVKYAVFNWLRDVHSSSPLICCLCLNNSFDVGIFNFIRLTDDFDERKNKIEYGQSIPSSESYTELPVKLPPHLKKSYLPINCPVNSLDPYVLPIPNHVTLNHLTIMNPNQQPTKTTAASSSALLPCVRDDVVVTSVTQRFKTKPYISVMPKFVTLVYYRPKNAPPGEQATSQDKAAASAAADSRGKADVDEAGAGGPTAD